MDFRGVKRKELQALCKKNGIPANLSNLDMAQRLTSLFKEKEKPVTRGRSCLKKSDSVEAGSKEAKKVSFSPVNETFEFVTSETDNVKENPRATRAARRRSMSKPPENGGNSIEPLIGEPTSASVEEIGRPKKRQLRNREVAVVEVENTGTKKNVVQGNHRKRNNVKSSREDKTFAAEVASFAPGIVRRRSKRNLEKAGSSSGVDFHSEFKRDTESRGLDPNAVCRREPLKCPISEGVSNIDEGVEEHMELPPSKGRQRGSKLNAAIAINKSNVASTSEERVADEDVRINVPLKQRREAHRRKETNATNEIKKEMQKKNRNPACKEISSVPENEPVLEEPVRRSSRIGPKHDPVVPAGMCENAPRRREQQTQPKSVIMGRGSEIKESETARSPNSPVLSPMKKVSEKKMKGKKGSRSKSQANDQHRPDGFNPVTTELEKGKDVVTATVVPYAPDQHSDSSAKQQHHLEEVIPAIIESEEGKDVVTVSIAATSPDQRLQIPLCEALVSTEVENMVESDHVDHGDDGCLSLQKGGFDYSNEVKSQLKDSETARSSNSPVLSPMKKVSEKKMKGKKGSRTKSHAKEQHSPGGFNPVTTELEKGKDVVTATVVPAAPDQHSNSTLLNSNVETSIAATSSDQKPQIPLCESLVSTDVENMLVESYHVDQGDDGCLSHQKGDFDVGVKSQPLDYQDQPSGALAKGCSPIHNLDQEAAGSYVIALDRWNGKENEGSPIGGCFEVIHAAEGEITSVLKEQNMVEYEEQTVGEPDLFVTAVENFDCKSSESKLYEHNSESGLGNIKDSGEFNVCDGKEENLCTLKEGEYNEAESSVTHMTASGVVLHEVMEKNQSPECKAFDSSDEVIRSGYSVVVSERETLKNYGGTSHTIDENIPSRGTSSGGRDFDDYQLRNLSVNNRDIIQKEGNSNLTTRMMDDAVCEGGTLLSCGFEGFNQKISQEAGEMKQSDEKGIAHSPSASPRNSYVGVSKADGCFSPNLAGFFLDKDLSGDDEVSESRVLTSFKATKDGNEGNEASWSQHRRGYHKDMIVTESLDHDHRSSFAHDHDTTQAANCCSVVKRSDFECSSALALEIGKEMEVEERSSVGQDRLPVTYSAKDDMSSFNRGQNLVGCEEAQGVAGPIIYKSAGLNCDSELKDIEPKKEISPHVFKEREIHGELTKFVAEKEIEFTTSEGLSNKFSQGYGLQDIFMTPTYRTNITENEGSFYHKANLMNVEVSEGEALADNASRSVDEGRPSYKTPPIGNELQQDNAVTSEEVDNNQANRFEVPGEKHGVEAEIHEELSIVEHYGIGSGYNNERMPFSSCSFSVETCISATEQVQFTEPATDGGSIGEASASLQENGMSFVDEQAKSMEVLEGERENMIEFPISSLGKPTSGCCNAEGRERLIFNTNINKYEENPIEMCSPTLPVKKVCNNEETGEGNCSVNSIVTVPHRRSDAELNDAFDGERFQRDADFEDRKDLVIGGNNQNDLSPFCPLGLEQVVLKSDEGLENICFDDGKAHSPKSSTFEHKNDADVLEENCSLVQSSELMAVGKYNLKKTFLFSVDAAEEENNKALDGKFEVDDSDSVAIADTSEDLAECMEKNGLGETVNRMDTLHRGESVVQQDTDEPLVMTSVALGTAEKAVCLDGEDTIELLDEFAEILLQNDDFKCKDFANYREELDLRDDKRATFKSDEVADRNKSIATAASTISLVHNDFAGDASQQVSPEEILGHYPVKEEGCTVNDDDAPISILGHLFETDPGQSEMIIDGKVISENIKGETSSCKTPLSSLRSSNSSMRHLQNSMRIESLADAFNYKLSTVSELDLSSSQGNDALELNFFSKEIEGELAKTNSGESETNSHCGASQDKPTSIVMAAEDENSNQMEKKPCTEKESAKMNHALSAVSKEPVWEDETFSIEFQAASPHELVMAEAVVMDSCKASALDEPANSSVQKTNVEYVMPLSGLNTLGDTETVGLNEGIPNQTSSMTSLSSAFISMPPNIDSTAEDAQVLEPSTAVHCERRKQDARVEEQRHFSARKFYPLDSSGMKGVKRSASYMIQSAPKRSVKMLDMKENAQSIKREHISSSITTKRQALEELQTSPRVKGEQLSNIGAQTATKRQASEKLQTTPNIKSEQMSHTTAKTARSRQALEDLQTK